MSKNNRSARAFYVLVHFYAVRRPLQNNNFKSPSFMFSWEREHMTAKCWFVAFPCFNAVYSNLVPGQFASIFQVKQISIIAKEIQKREVIFWNDVFVAVAVVAAKTLYYFLRSNFFQFTFFSSALRRLLLMRLTTIISFTLLIVLVARTNPANGCRVSYNGCSDPTGLAGWKGTFTPHCNKHDVCYYCVRNSELYVIL